MTPMPDKDRKHLVSSILGGKLNEVLKMSLAEPIPASEAIAHTTLTTEEHHLTPMGAVHGGIMAACLDTTALMSCVNVLNEGEHASTVSSALRFMASTAGVGKEIHFHVNVLKRTRRLVFCEGEARSAGVVLIKGSFVKAIIEPRPSKL